MIEIQLLGALLGIFVGCMGIGAGYSLVGRVCHRNRHRPLHRTWRPARVATMMAKPTRGMHLSRTGRGIGAMK